MLVEHLLHSRVTPFLTLDAVEVLPLQDLRDRERGQALREVVALDQLDASVDREPFQVKPGDGVVANRVAGARGWELIGAGHRETLAPVNRFGRSGLRRHRRRIYIQDISG